MSNDAHHSPKTSPLMSPHTRIRTTQRVMFFCCICICLLPVVFGTSLTCTVAFLYKRGYLQEYMRGTSLVWQCPHSCTHPRARAHALTHAYTHARSYERVVNKASLHINTIGTFNLRYFFTSHKISMKHES